MAGTSPDFRGRLLQPPSRPTLDQVLRQQRLQRGPPPAHIVGEPDGAAAGLRGDPARDVRPSPARIDSSHFVHVPHSTFQTHDRRISITCIGDTFFERFLTVVAGPELRAGQ